MIEISKTVGRLTIHLTARPIGRDWNIVLYGGDRPHIGAVALAVPENSDNSDNPESSCLLLCLPNHREGELAKRFASAIASHVNATVCVSCGIHLENITRDEILLVQNLVESFISELFDRISVSL